MQISSAGQAPIDFDDLMLTRSYSGGQAYCQSKLAEIMFTFDLADELAGTAVTATALHPATYMPTKMVARPVSTLKSGDNSQREARADPQAYDPVARARLRTLSDQLTGLSGA